MELALVNKVIDSHGARIPGCAATCVMRICPCLAQRAARTLRRKTPDRHTHGTTRPSAAGEDLVTRRPRASAPRAALRLSVPMLLVEPHPTPHDSAGWRGPRPRAVGDHPRIQARFHRGRRPRGTALGGGCPRPCADGHWPSSVRTGRALQNATFRGAAAFRCADFFWAGWHCGSLSRLRRGACGTRHAIFDEQNSLRLSTRREDAALYILIYYSRILTRGAMEFYVMAPRSLLHSLVSGLICGSLSGSCGGTRFLSRVTFANFGRPVFTTSGLSW